jgi:hypothetical protein
MADQVNRLQAKEMDKAAPRRDRSFAPLSQDEIKSAKPALKEQDKAKRRAAPMGSLPPARVDPLVVRELEREVAQKVTSGRRRMRWFANHLILFVAGVAGAVPLKFYIFPEMPNAFLYVPFGVWVGLLAIHLNYAMTPILKRSKAEAQLKALMPQKDENQREFDWDKK